jgi:hypothetical protein
MGGIGENAGRNGSSIAILHCHQFQFCCEQGFENRAKEWQHHKATGVVSHK